MIFPRSHFRSGAIFVLLVAIPALPLLLLIHATFLGTFGIKFHSESCDTICIREKETTEKNEDNLEDDPETTTAKVNPKSEFKFFRMERDTFFHKYETINDNKTLMNPFIAALLDMTEEYDMVLKCPLAIVSSEVALTTSNCINHPYKIKQLLVRTNSNYWWKEGDVNPVLQIAEKKIYPKKKYKRDKWLAVKFKRPEKSRFYIYSLVIAEPYTNTFFDRKTYFWNLMDNSLQESTLPEEYETYASSLKESYSCKQEDATSFENAPIVSGRHLIGFHGKIEANKSICYYIKTFGVNSWCTELVLDYKQL